MSGGRGRVCVIGGGIAGLASAALLARDGWQVELLEQRDEVGGRAGSWSAGGFRFDTGPSWYLMPDVFEHFFNLLGTNSAEQLDLQLLDPGYKVLFEGRVDPLEVSASRRSVGRSSGVTSRGPNVKWIDAIVLHLGGLS